MKFESARSTLAATDVLPSSSLVPALDPGSLTTAISGLERPRSSLLFVDAGVQDYQQLLTTATPGTEVHLLDSVQDAVAQITQTLAGRSGISSVQIVSHGAAGELDLGGQQLSLSTLPTYVAQVQSWGQALTEDADILLYGCNVAQGELGQAFVQILSQLTGADVAASENFTGSSALGGDWVLEYQTGQIESESPWSGATREDYAAVLSFAPASNFSVGDPPIAVAVADLNGDGKADIVTANLGPSTGSVLLNTGTGSFSPATNFPLVAELITLGDLNGDGKADLVAASGGNFVSVLLGTGTGGFGATNQFVAAAPTASVSSVAIADFNGDGKADLVVGSYNSRNISVLLGTGTGSFGPATSFVGAVGGSYRVVVGDFNSDSKADIVTANYDSRNVSVLLGTGTGGFGPATSFSIAANPTSLATGDFNGDGKADLVAANFVGSDVSVLLGTGTGSFGTPNTFGVGVSPYTVAVGDFNGDGKADITTANNDTNNVSILLGSGAGSFAAATNLPVGTAPLFVAIADFNGDGKADIVAANEGSSNVSVLLNTSPLFATPILTLFQLQQSFPLNAATQALLSTQPPALQQLFDEEYYLSQNPDVAAAVGNGSFQSGLQHFIAYGTFEGRNPSALYNEQYYLSQNPDVAAAVGNGSFRSGFQHFLSYGQFEARNPSTLFNEQRYLSQNPDVAPAVRNGSFRSGFQHFLNYGFAEGRLANLTLFNELYYLSQNPDVAAAVARGSFKSGLQHFEAYGKREGRRPSLLFDERSYLSQNPDVAAAVARGQFQSGFDHYLNYGRFEGRSGVG